MSEHPGNRGLPLQVVLAGVATLGVLYLLTALVAKWEGKTSGSYWDPGSHGITGWFDVARSVATFVGVFGAGVLAVLAYRRQRTSEAVHHDARAVDLRTRFAAATEQLGHGSAAVRLAGVYALAQLADDWAKSRTIEGHTEQVQQCIDVLCAYYRLPHDPDSERAKGGDHEVRATVLRVITAHLQDPKSPTSWCGKHLDFSGAVFDRGCSFHAASFTDGSVSFDGAKFTGGEVDFVQAKFTGGAAVSFVRARFSGANVNFSEAEFSSSSVSLGGAKFHSGAVSFFEAKFTGGARVVFDWAEFTGADLGFGRAKFTGGSVSFLGAQFNSGDASFFEAKFTGGDVSFNIARFTGGDVSFRRARFTGGDVSFRRARFTGGSVSFDGAKFVGGTVDFRDPASWETPPHVDWEDGDAPPPGVEPSPWPPGE